MKRIFLYTVVFCLPLFMAIMSFMPPDSNGLVDGVLVQTNQFRKSQGLPGLVMRDELNKIAKKHSLDMASGRVPFGHQGFGDRDAQAKKVILGIHGFAENVASGQLTSVEVVNLWKNSPGHRRNMVGAYKYVGIGTATDKQGIIYFTQIFAD
jgi:uncharacterized protein YkwD